jgi:NSS family neurotransmitter:Na+ symporter
MVLAPLFIVVGGWTFSYGVSAWHGQFLNIDPQAASSVFHQVISTPGQTMFWAGAVLSLAIGISLLGVVHGLGLAARILVPTALALFVGVAYYSRHFGDLDATFDWLFTVNWEQVSWRSLMLALVQAVFSLGIGTGVMITLGAYLPYEDDIPVAAFSIVLVELFLAVLAGYVILPMLFASNIEPAGGAAMLFIGVPVAFGGLVNGQLFTVALYFAVLIAALTSITALMEPAVAVLRRVLSVPRYIAVLAVGFLLWLLVLACLYSFAGWEYGHWFYALDSLTHFLLPAMAMGVAVLMGWLAAPMIAEHDFDLVPYWIYRSWRFTVRWLSLPAMFLVWLSYLTDAS